MNIFEEVLSRLNSKTSTRSLFSDVHPDDLQKIINRMSAVLEEKIKIKELEIEQRKEKKKKSIIKQIQQTMKENDLSLDDFYDEDSDLQSLSRKNLRKKYSFQYITPTGDTVYWYGSTVGRVPKAFQSYLDRTGKKRMDCITNENADQAESPPEQ